MEKARSMSAFLCLIFLIPVFITACTHADTVPDTAFTDTGDETGKSTENTEADTEQPPDETDKFNYGKVIYTKTETDYSIAEFPDDRIGAAVKKDEEGVVTLFYSDFSDNNPGCGGAAISRTEEATGVIDGVLYIPYSSTSDNHLSGGWTTWEPDVAVPVSEYKQSQLSADLRFYSVGESAWTSSFIGCFVDNFTFKIPDNPGDGIWFSFNENAKRVNLFAADSKNWRWPQGNAYVEVDGSLINGNTHLDVICTQDKQIYVKLKDVTVMHVVCKNAEVIAYDGDENEIYRSDFDINDVSGEHYTVFVHGGGGAMIDEISVYGCSKGIEDKQVNVTATPVGGNTLGCDITDRNDAVGICYTMWFNAIHGDGDGKIESALNVTELKELYGFSTQYGFGDENEQHNASPAFHYWAKPAQGYYRSTDKSAIRNNMTLLYKAGVDFLILDYTYATSPGYDPGTSAWSSYISKPSTALLDTIMEMRAEGSGTPYVVFWMGNENMFDHIYKNFYSVEKWEDCFVYWNGKPFIMDWEGNATETNKFTVRSMYGLRGKVKPGQWSYLEVDNSETVSYTSDKKAEQVGVCVATQETYMSMPTAHGRDGGKFWNKQWQTAFEVRPKIVTLTWWNEWCAQLLYVDGVGYAFTDNFDIEHSRDIEPMEGGHGDQYYRWLCEYIRAYRAGEPCPELIEK